ncbi:hypothetical protein [Paenibacillus terrigena]|uniref:hypothetical protein n=1 Tax=Paenibacillus terrigena TaxID=369333 RepID=UPI0028D1C644|nr:hypothetical protein [Paenibacillus terrigena]
MKRYLLSIVLGVCTLGILCTYYTYGAADHLPEYKLTTVQGDPKEGTVIELSGNYGGRMRSEPLSVTVDGSKYRSRETLRDQILGARSWVYNNKEMEQWIRDHRQFMRGKDYLEGFYKDEEWLIYVTGSTRVGLSVERLNLKTNEVQQYTTKIPVQVEKGVYNVVDVQKVKDKLHVITLQDTKAMQSQQPTLQYFHYVLNFDNGTLIQSEQITHWKNTKKNIETDYYTMYNAGAPNKYLAFTVTENKISDKKENSYTSERIATHIYVYSYQTGKLVALPDPKQQFNPRTNYYHEGDQILYTTYDNQLVQLSRYNLATGLEERDYATLKASQFGADEVQSVIVSGNRAYVSLMKGTSPKAVALDTADGSVRYVGEVSFEGPASERAKEMKLLQLYNLNISS